jgi:hypothetical protein
MNRLNLQTSPARRTAWLFGAVLPFLAALLLAGCRSPATTAGGPPSITADPNPVAATGAEKKGKTTISWDTGDGSVGQVYFSVNNGEEKLWLDNRAKGSQEAPWIKKGAVYEFRLYAGRNREKVLASVQVTAQ